MLLKTIVVGIQICSQIAVRINAAYVPVRTHHVVAAKRLKDILEERSIDGVIRLCDPHEIMDGKLNSLHPLSEHTTRIHCVR